jgi:PAS domain S-box-containing protein
MAPRQRQVRLRPAWAIIASMVAVVAVVVALTLLATLGEAWLPMVMAGHHYTDAMVVVVSGVWLCSVCALAALLRRKPKSVLDLWLMVVMFAWLLDMALSAMLNAGRFDLGFYLGRMYGLGASSFVLLILLVEAIGMYRQLATVDDRMRDLANREGMTRLLDAAMDGIITIDEQQRIVLFNPAAESIFGWSSADMLQQPLTRLMPARFHHGHAQLVRQFGNTGVTSRRMGTSAIIHGQRANGEEFPLEASISQLATTHGKLFTVIVRDVTERERAQRELADFANEASAMLEQEKARVARELHDELAQSLTALKMDALWLRNELAGATDPVHAKLAQMTTMLDASVAATRRIAADLRPMLLDDLGLAAALEWLTQNFSQRSSIDCTLEMDEALELQEPHATAVFRIVQESLTNVAKHARATQAQVQVDCTAQAVTLRMSDNGQGFVVTTPRKPHSLGLMGLRERVKLLNGNLDIDSQPGQGTRITVRLPLVLSTR